MAWVRGEDLCLCGDGLCVCGVGMFVCMAMDYVCVRGDGVWLWPVRVAVCSCSDTLYLV